MSWPGPRAGPWRATAVAALIRRGSMPTMTADDEEKLRQLRHRRAQNNEVSWRLFDYLSDRPRFIRREDLDHLSSAGDREAAFRALLAAACGLDVERREEDLRLLRDYFVPGVHLLDAAAYRRDPYFSRIRIPEASLGRWQLTRERYAPCEAFVCDDILSFDDFREVQRIGFFDEAFSFPAVTEDGREWMAIKPNEIASMRAPIAAVRGEVVTLGLGLGYFAHAAALKADVRRVTVVERDEGVIELFERHLLPQFERPEKIRVICADAFDFARDELPRASFDFAFCDLWHDVADGLKPYVRLKQLERRAPGTRFLYWIEAALLSNLRFRLFEQIVASAASYGEVVRRLGDESLRQIAQTIAW